MRLFVAIELSEDVRARVAALLGELRAIAPDAKWTRAEKLHVTLAFLGEQPAERVAELSAAVARACAGHRALKLRAAGGGAFGHARKPKVLWIGLGGDTEALARLHHSLAEALAPFGYVNEHGQYTAHLTLARAKRPHGDASLARCVEKLASAQLGEFTVNEVLLMESKGGHYVALSRSPLPS